MSPGIRNVEQVATKQSWGKNQIKSALKKSLKSLDFTSSEIFLTQKVCAFSGL